MLLQRRHVQLASWQQHQQQSHCSAQYLSSTRVRGCRAVIPQPAHQHALLSVQEQCASPMRHAPTKVGAAAAAGRVVAAHAAVAAGVTAADPCLELMGIKSRAVGCLLGAMCANALGAQVEPEKHYRLSRMFPFGLGDMSWTFDISSSPLPPGHVTGDYVIMTAVAQSVVRCGAAEALDITDCMAASYDESAPEQWYSPYNKLMLEGLAAGSNPFLLAHHAEGYLTSTSSRASNSASHRPGRQLHGMSDFSALARVLPVAVAYREAPLQVLRQAADAAVLLTHPSDAAADAAAVIAAAVAWCLRADPHSCSPQQLLQHLLDDVATTADMKHKLVLLMQRLPAVADLGCIDNWPAFWQSKAWGEVTSVANLLTKQNLAIEATQAAALALWVAVVNWQHPQQAVMLAASLGGYAATTGILVGGLVGALHGCNWIPAPWWEQLQDEPEAEQAPQSQHSSQQPVEASRETEQTLADAGSGDGGGEEQQGQSGENPDSDWMLRPVSKYSVVVLGHQLAELNCQRVPALL